MKKLVVLNNKMYLDYSNIREYILNIKDIIRSDLDVVVCPSNIFLPFFSGRYKFKLGAQNIAGVFSTGEVSGFQLKSLGVNYVLIGHLERRILFNETNKMINLKVKEALDNGIAPIICLGETIEERERRKTQDVILKQIKECLRGIEVFSDIIFAYDPIWAIGNEDAVSNEEIEEIVTLIKNAVFMVHNVKVKVLYGGSLNEENIKRINKIKNLDGYIIGKNSVNIDKISAIMNEID